MRATIIGLMFASVPAFACPNLAGKYAACRFVTGNGTGATNLEITQEIQNRATIYTWTSTDSVTRERSSEIYKADGRKYVQTETDPESGMKMSLSTQVSCVGSAVVAKMILTIDNEIISSLNVNVSKAGNTITQISTGDNMGDPVHETMVCE